MYDGWVYHTFDDTEAARLASWARRSVMGSTPMMRNTERGRLAFNFGYELDAAIRRRYPSYTDEEFWDNFSYGYWEEVYAKIATMLRTWVRKARNNLNMRRVRLAEVAYRPGGAGYLEARRDFMVRSGQTRATRSYRPY